VLLGFSRIRTVINVEGLIVIEFECHDGERLHYYSGRRYHQSKESSPTSS
jgi:hypothetical protein